MSNNDARKIGFQRCPYIGTPSFKDVSLKHKNGILSIKARNVSEENIYIQSLKLNGKPYNKSWLKHEDIFGDNATLEFEMVSTPNKKWAGSKKARPPSMINEKY